MFPLEPAPAGKLMFFLTRGSFFRFSSRRLFATTSTFFSSLRPGHSRSRPPSLGRSHPSRRFLSLRGSHPSRCSPFPRRGHPGRTRSPFLGGSHASRCSPFFRRGHPGRTRFPSLGVGFFNGATLESFLPPTALATMVLFIELPPITLTSSVLAPIGILSTKTLPVMRISLVPRIPPRGIPGFWSYDIGGSISVIRAPSVLRAEKVIQDAIQKPVAVVIDPRRIRPHPRCRVRIRGRGWILDRTEHKKVWTWRRGRLHPARLPAPRLRLIFSYLPPSDFFQDDAKDNSVYQRVNNQNPKLGKSTDLKTSSLGTSKCHPKDRDRMPLDLGHPPPGFASAPRPVMENRHLGLYPIWGDGLQDG